MISKLRKIYSNLNIGVKATLWFAICNIVQKGIYMLTVPIFTRLMTTKEYGVYSIFQSWYNILIIIVTLYLFAGVYNKGMMKYDDHIDSFTSSIQGLSTTVTCIFFGIYFIFKNYWNCIFDLNTICMITMFLQLFFAPSYLYWSARQRFEYRYKALFITTLIIAILSSILGILSVMYFNDKSTAIIISFSIVQIFVGLFFWILNFIKGKCFFQKEEWIYCLKFNLPLIPHYLSQIVLSQSDRVMIGKISGMREAAIYSVTYNISLVMSLITNAMNYALIPTLYKKLKKKEYDKTREISNYVILIAACLVGFSMLFGPELIRIFGPKEYYEARWIIPSISASVFFIVVYTLFVNVEFYFDNTSYTMYVSILGAIANVILNYLLVPKFGYFAAGYTTLACYILFSIGHCLLFCLLNKKKWGNLPILDLKFIGAVSVILTVWMFIALLLYNSLILRFIIIAVIFISILVNYKKIASMFKGLKTTKPLDQLD